MNALLQSSNKFTYSTTGNDGRFAPLKGQHAFVYYDNDNIRLSKYLMPAEGEAVGAAVAHLDLSALLDGNSGDEYIGWGEYTGGIWFIAGSNDFICVVPSDDFLTYDYISRTSSNVYPQGSSTVSESYNSSGHIYMSLFRNAFGATNDISVYKVNVGSNQFDFVADINPTNIGTFPRGVCADLPPAADGKARFLYTKYAGSGSAVDMRLVEIVVDSDISVSERLVMQITDSNHLDYFGGAVIGSDASDWDGFSPLFVYHKGTGSLLIIGPAGLLTSSTGYAICCLDVADAYSVRWSLYDATETLSMNDAGEDHKVMQFGSGAWYPIKIGSWEDSTSRIKIINLNNGATYVTDDFPENAEATRLADSGVIIDYINGNYIEYGTGGSENDEYLYTYVPTTSWLSVVGTGLFGYSFPTHGEVLLGERLAKGPIVSVLNGFMASLNDVLEGLVDADDGLFQEPLSLTIDLNGHSLTNLATTEAGRLEVQA